MIVGAGLQPDALRILGAMRERNQRLPLPAALWLHRNTPRGTAVPGGQARNARIASAIGPGCVYCG